MQKDFPMILGLQVFFDKSEFVCWSCPSMMQHFHIRSLQRLVRRSGCNRTLQTSSHLDAYKRCARICAHHTTVYMISTTWKTCTLQNRYAWSCAAVAENRALVLKDFFKHEWVHLLTLSQQNGKLHSSVTSVQRLVQRMWCYVRLSCETRTTENQTTENHKLNPFATLWFHTQAHHPKETWWALRKDNLVF